MPTPDKIMELAKYLGARLTVTLGAIVQHGVVIWLLGSGTIELQEIPAAAAVITSGTVAAIVGYAGITGRTQTDLNGKAVAAPPPPLDGAGD